MAIDPSLAAKSGAKHKSESRPHVPRDTRKISIQGVDFGPHQPTISSPECHQNRSLDYSNMNYKDSSSERRDSGDWSTSSMAHPRADNSFWTSSRASASAPLNGPSLLATSLSYTSLSAVSPLLASETCEAGPSALNDNYLSQGIDQTLLDEDALVQQIRRLSRPPWDVSQEGDRMAYSSSSSALGMDSSSQSSSCCLPTEILLQVIDYLWSDQRALLSCASVCMEWNYCVTTLLYRYPKFASTLHWAMFIQVLCQSNETARPKARRRRSIIQSLSHTRQFSHHPPSRLAPAQIEVYGGKAKWRTSRLCNNLGEFVRGVDLSKKPTTMDSTPAPCTCPGIEYSSGSNGNSAQQCYHPPSSNSHAFALQDATRTVSSEDSLYSVKGESLARISSFTSAQSTRNGSNLGGGEGMILGDNGTRENDSEDLWSTFYYQEQLARQQVLIRLQQADESLAQERHTYANASGSSTPTLQASASGNLHQRPINFMNASTLENQRQRFDISFHRNRTGQTLGQYTTLSNQPTSPSSPSALPWHSFSPQLPGRATEVSSSFASYNSGHRHQYQQNATRPALSPHQGSSASEASIPSHTGDGSSVEARYKKPITITVSSLIQMARHCPNLESLCLGSTMLTHDTLYLETGDYQSTLQPGPRTGLTFVPVTAADGVKALGNSCRKLQQLWLAGCEWVTVEEVRTLVNYCRQLRVLDLRHCGKLEARLSQLFVVESEVETMGDGDKDAPESDLGPGTRGNKDRLGTVRSGGSNQPPSQARTGSFQEWPLFAQQSAPTLPPQRSTGAVTAPATPAIGGHAQRPSSFSRSSSQLFSALSSSVSLPLPSGFAVPGTGPGAPAWPWPGPGFGLGLFMGRRPETETDETTLELPDGLQTSLVDSRPVRNGAMFDLVNLASSGRMGVQEKIQGNGGGETVSSGMTVQLNQETLSAWSRSEGTSTGHLSQNYVVSDDEDESGDRLADV